MRDSIDEVNPQAQRVWVEFQVSARIIGISLATCREHVHAARTRAQSEIQLAGLDGTEPVR